MSGDGYFAAHAPEKVEKTVQGPRRGGGLALPARGGTPWLDRSVAGGPRVGPSERVVVFDRDIRFLSKLAIPGV